MADAWNMAKPEWLVAAASMKGTMSESNQRETAIHLAREIIHVITEPKSVKAAAIIVGGKNRYTSEFALASHHVKTMSRRAAKRFSKSKSRDDLVEWVAFNCLVTLSLSNPWVSCRKIMESLARVRKPNWHKRARFIRLNFSPSFNS